MPQQYDYIITGAGCAGLSLLQRMMKQDFFQDKKILLIDKTGKKTNDRTWCFWEQQPGVFEDIVYHQWKQIDFYSNYFSARYDIDPYSYKMIRGIDLYNSVLKEAKQHRNITLYIGNVHSVHYEEEHVTVKAGNDIFYGDYIFNSIIFDDWKKIALQQKNIHLLLQHFKGWLIQTPEPVFNEHIATFMDFRVSQELGATFIYVLPVANNKALIEYTLFTKKILQQQAYDDALANYIQSFLKIINYNVIQTEFGIIPMTNYPFSKGEGRIINLGTAGGQTKASTGYTFQFIQKHSDAIAAALINNKDPLLKSSLLKSRFNLYDNILLNILENKKMAGDKLFAQLFKENSPQKIFKFLDNETSIIEELKIMNTVPFSKFVSATFKEIF